MKKNINFNNFNKRSRNFNIIKKTKKKILNIYKIKDFIHRDAKVGYTIKPLAFIKLIIRSDIKNGHKYRSIKNLYLSFIKLKFEHNLSFIEFANKVFGQVRPAFMVKNKFLGKMKYRLPSVIDNTTKDIKISASWFLKSYRSMKEKRAISRLYAEFNNILLNKGESIKKKKAYYVEFFKNKSNIRYLRLLNKK